MPRKAFFAYRRLSRKLAEQHFLSVDAVKAHRKRLHDFAKLVGYNYVAGTKPGALE